MEIDKWYVVKLFFKCIFSKFLNEICKVVSVEINYIFYCFRVIVIIYFSDFGYESRYIMFMLNYKSESLLKFYNRLMLFN